MNASVFFLSFPWIFTNLEWRLNMMAEFPQIWRQPDTTTFHWYCIRSWNYSYHIILVFYLLEYVLDTDCIHLSHSEHFLFFCGYNFTFRYGKNPAAPSGKNAAAALCMHPVLCFPVLIYSLIYSLIIEPQNQKILWTGRNL